MLRRVQRGDHRRALPAVRELRDPVVDLSRTCVGQRAVWCERVCCRRSSVDLAEHDVLRADHGDDVGQHVADDHLVQRREMREARRAHLRGDTACSSRRTRGSTPNSPFGASTAA